MVADIQYSLFKTDTAKDSNITIIDCFKLWRRGAEIIFTLIPASHSQKKSMQNKNVKLRLCSQV